MLELKQTSLAATDNLLTLSTVIDLSLHIETFIEVTAAFMKHFGLKLLLEKA
jgi:hypothetical protein